MAKRQKLNKRVAVLLGVVGGVFLIVVAALIIYNLKPDAQRLAENAKIELERKNYREAAKLYRLAAVNAEEARKTEYYLALGRTFLEWRAQDPTLGPSQQNQFFIDARNALEKALRYDQNSVPTLSLLLDMDEAIAVARRDWSDFVRRADQLLAIEPDNHQVRFRRIRGRMTQVPNRTGLAEQVDKEFRDLVKQAPQQEEYWLAYGGFLRWRDRNDDAEKVYGEGLEALPDSSKLRVAYSELLSATDRKDEALAMLKQAIAVQPKEVTGHLGMAHYYRLQRDAVQAIEALQGAIEADPTDYRGYLELAQVLSYQKDFKQGKAVLEKGLEALRKLPAESPSALAGRELAKYREGIILLNQGLVDVLFDGYQTDQSAEAVLEEVRARLAEMQGIDRGSAYVEKVQGRLALAEKQFVEAEAHLRAANERLSGMDIRTGELLAGLYSMLGQYGDADLIMQRFRLMAKDNPDVLLTLAKLSIDSRQYGQALDYLTEALKHRQPDDTDNAMKVALEIATGRSERIPQDLPGLTPQAEGLILERARQLWEEGRQNAGSQLAMDVLNKNNRSMAAMGHLIVWYRSVQDAEQVKKVYDFGRDVFKDEPAALRRLEIVATDDPEKALALELEEAQNDSNELRRHLRMAELYMTVGKKAEWLDQLKQAEEKEPENPVVVESLFDYYAAEGDQEMMEKYARIAQSTDADKVEGRVFRARLAAAQGKSDEAIQLAREAVRIRPKFSNGHSLLGHLLYQSGKVEQAKVELEEAFRQNKANYRALLGLVQVSEELGNRGDYAYYVQLAYERNPRHPLIREKWLRIRETRDSPENLIKQREYTAKMSPDDLTNLTELARLYEQVGRLPEAELAYSRLVKSPGATRLHRRQYVMFLHRTNRDQDAQAFLADNAEHAADKVDAYLMWAEYLHVVNLLGQAENAFQKARELGPEDVRVHWNSTQFYFATGQYEKALASQRKYVELAVENPLPGANALLILCMIEAGHYDEAAQRIDKALAANPRDVEAMTQKGLLLFRKGDHAAAKAMFGQALAVDPQRVQALEYRADVHAALGDSALEEADLVAARRLSRNPEIVYRLYKLYSRQDDFVKAHGLLQSYLAEMPLDATGHVEMINLCERMRRWQPLAEALQTAQKALPRDPDFFKAEARMWLLRENPAAALAAANQANRLSPGDPETGLLTMQGLVLSRLFEDAARVGETLRNQEDVAARAMAIRGTALLSMGKEEEAQEEFKAALVAAVDLSQMQFILEQVQAGYGPNAPERLAAWRSAKPTSWMMPYMVGVSCSMALDYEKAAELYLEALAKAPDDRSKLIVLRELALVYNQLGKNDDSLKTYKAAIELEANDPRLLNNMAWLYANDLKNPQEALPYAERAQRLLPGNARILDTLGIIYLSLDKDDLARDILRRSMDIEKIPANLYHYASVLKKAGDPEADRYFRQGWEMVKDDPSNEYHKPLQKAVNAGGGVE